MIPIYFIFNTRLRIEINYPDKSIINRSSQCGLFAIDSKLKKNEAN
jgi:hypothetical protein